jgi:hypothetical protein
MTGLENPLLFALQESNKIDRQWQPSVALEICKFLSRRSLTPQEVKSCDLVPIPAVR